MAERASTLLWTPDEAAAHIRVSPRTLRDLKRRGLIRYVAVTERKIMYRPEDCEEYLSSRLRLDPPCQPRPKHRRTVPSRRNNVIPFSKQIGA